MTIRRTTCKDRVIGHTCALYFMTAVSESEAIRSLVLIDLDGKFFFWKSMQGSREPLYLFNCSYRNLHFSHFRVPLEVGREIIESMYGNISGDSVPRYIATAGGKIPVHRSNVVGNRGGDIVSSKPWSGEEVLYPDVEQEVYGCDLFAIKMQEK